jgi:hypothetical protein
MLPSSRGIDSYLVDLKTSAFDEIKFEYEDVRRKNHDIGIEEHFKITIIPKGSNLYQGAVYTFKTELSTKKMGLDYCSNYYDTRHNGAYFVGPREVADRYGKKIDESRIVYATMPDAGNTSVNQQFLYPICYIPGIKGSRVTYKTNAQLKLLDISDIPNVRILWNVTEAMAPDEKEEIQDMLMETVVDATQYLDSLERDPPWKLKRNSKDWFDEELVSFFRNDVIPYVERVYGQTLHGYIHHQMEGNDFHDEIMLLDKTLLDFVSVESEPPTEYPGLISVEEWKKQHDATKVENTEVFRNAVTLIPSTRNILYKV